MKGKITISNFQIIAAPSILRIDYMHMEISDALDEYHHQLTSSRTKAGHPVNVSLRRIALLGQEMF